MSSCYKLFNNWLHAPLVGCRTWPRVTLRLYCGRVSQSLSRSSSSVSFETSRCAFVIKETLTKTDPRRTLRMASVKVHASKVACAATPEVRVRWDARVVNRKPQRSVLREYDTGRECDSDSNMPISRSRAVGTGEARRGRRRNPTVWLYPPDQQIEKWAGPRWLWRGGQISNSLLGYGSSKSAVESVAPLRKNEPKFKLSVHPQETIMPRSRNAGYKTTKHVRSMCPHQRYLRFP